MRNKETIELVSPDDPRVQQLQRHLLDTPLFTARGVILFGGDRWSCVEVVALLTLHGAPAGMATLAPTNEMRGGGPHLIALWLDPEIGEPFRSEVGARMLTMLAEESLRRYHAQPHMTTVSQTEWDAAELAKKRGASLSFDGVTVWQW